MAVKKKLTAAIPTQLTPEWRKRVRAVADHPRTQVSMAQVIRDCIEVALPGFELELGLIDLDDLSEGELQVLGLERAPKEPEGPAPVREDRAKGSFGWTPPQG